MHLLLPTRTHTHAHAPDCLSVQKICSRKPWWGAFRLQSIGLFTTLHYAGQVVHIVQRNEVYPLLNGDIKRWVERLRMIPILASIFYAIF